jgi:hypothetical protein
MSKIPGASRPFNGMFTITLLLCAALGSACIPYAGKRTPRLPKPRVVPEFADSAQIQLDVVDRSSNPKMVKRSLEYVNKKFPFVSSPTERIADPDYRIVLRVTNSSDLTDETDWLWFWLLVPLKESHEVTVTAVVRDATDRQIATFESIGRRRTFYHLFLYFTIPIAAPLTPTVQRNMWKNSFRDVMIQAVQSIATDQQDAA